jgi:hypothetical protein
METSLTSITAFLGRLWRVPHASSGLCTETNQVIDLHFPFIMQALVTIALSLMAGSTWTSTCFSYPHASSGSCTATNQLIELPFCRHCSLDRFTINFVSCFNSIVIGLSPWIHFHLFALVFCDDTR